jgi:rhodanese-related sulfurtransferase
MEMKMSKRKSKKKSSHRNWYLLGALLVLVVIVVVAILLNKQGVGGASATQLTYVITVQDAYQKYQEGVFILDVREPSEWDEFHIPNTTLIPLGELPDRLDEVPQDQPIVVVCRSGNRSQSGRDILVNAGFQNVTSMSGGVTQWSNLGYPIEGTRP